MNYIIGSMFSDYPTNFGNTMYVENLYDQLIKVLPDIIYEIDPEGNFIYLSEAIQVLGYRPEELMDKHYSIIIHPHDLRKIQRHFYIENFRQLNSDIDYDKVKVIDERRTDKRHTQGLKARLLPKDHYNFEKTFVGNISSIGIYDEQDGKRVFLGTMGAIQDISEETRLQRVLLLTERYYRNIIDHSSFVVSILAHDGMILYISGAIENSLGYSPVDMLGENFLELVHADDHGQIMALMDVVGIGQQAREAFIVRIRDQKNNWRYWECKPSYITDIHNHSSLILYSLDISDRLENEKLRLEKLKIEQENDLKTIFFASMSHDLRTPMNAIIGFTDILRDNLEKMEKAEIGKYLDIIKNSSGLLLSIVNDILDYSKIETNKLAIHNVSYSLKSILEIEELNVNVLITQSNKNIEFSMRYDKDMNFSIVGDPNRLQQVLNNLLGNAVKFTDQGYVSLDVELLSGDQSNDNMQKLQFIITDSGIGIPDSKQEIIFEPFNQSSIEITKKFGGTGLGLAISKKLVNLMGGEISVKKNKNGSGSQFIFTVPYAQADKEIPVKEANKYLKKYPNMAIFDMSLKVLIADDNNVNLLLLEKMLSDVGLATITAINGHAAIEAYSDNEDLDMILMDILMPVVNGLDAVKEIRRLEAQAGKQNRIPIVALTALVSSQDIDKCYQAGCNEYISKPVDRNMLFSVLEKYLINKPDSITLETGE